MYFDRSCRKLQRRILCFDFVLSKFSRSVDGTYQKQKQKPNRICLVYFVRTYNVGETFDHFVIYRKYKHSNTGTVFNPRPLRGRERDTKSFRYRMRKCPNENLWSGFRHTHPMRNFYRNDVAEVKSSQSARVVRSVRARSVRISIISRFMFQ
jgi:hypothetical protein